MTKNTYFIACLRRALLLVGFSVFTSAAHATCGSVNYTWGTDALHEMQVFILVMMEYVIGLLYAIGSLVSLYSATSITIKIHNGEQGITKNIMMLVGSIMFLIGATIVMPAFFGINWR